MSTYSVAQAKDQLSKLIDDVLEGKDVIITRHGKPVVEMRPSAPSPVPRRSTNETLEWLRKCREQYSPIEGPAAVDVVRTMRDDF